MALSIDVLSSYPPVQEAEVDKVLAEEIRDNEKKIVVLDDDPTGVQTVHDISVYTNWEKTSIEQGFAEENKLFYILTNSRGFTAAQTEKAHKEIAEVVDQVAKETGKEYLFISRSDSTLRGHYPLETTILKDEYEKNTGKKIDGEVLCPFFKEGGRFTIDDVHYVQYDDTLVPAAETEFAKDKTFGYTVSNLKEYVEEKTQGAYKKENVTAISLENIRELNYDKIEEQLLAVEDFNKVLNAEVWILGSDFNLKYSSDGSDLNSDSSKSIIISNFDPSDYQNGGHYQISNMYNIFKTDMLHVVHPIKSGSSSPYGYMLVHVSTASIKSSSYTITKIFYLTYFIILLLSLIIFFNFVWFIYAPLKDIRTAAMQYAQGNFDFDPIKIYSDDEIGDVANSLNYMASQLRDSNEYQQKFISNISHDFRSPLTSIKGYIEAIMDGTIPPEMQNKYLGIVLSEANRLEHLTNGLRDLNVWSNKGPELILEDFDILELIHSSIETLEAVSSKKNIKLTIVNEAKKTIVTADKGKIEQVIYNLIDNAIKFSFNDSEIIIRLYNNRGKLFCVIKDNGIGISHDNINKIWQRFYKTDSSRGMDKTGSGIGLSIVKEIISAHNETIDVISTEGVGTEFIFSLSLAKK